jgi:hypothetical protein
MLNQAATAGRVGGNLAQRYAKLQPYKNLLSKLSGVLGCCAPALCQRPQALGGAGLVEGGAEIEGSSAADPAIAGCGLADLGSLWDAGHWYTTFEGPLYAGKWFSEWLLLTYLNNMAFAWGALRADEVVELGSLVTLYRSFEFDAGAAAGAFGSALAAHLAASLDQWAANGPAAPGRAPAVGHGPGEDVVYYAAHGEMEANASLQLQP